MADSRLYSVPRLQALALGEARGRALALALEPLGVPSGALPSRGVVLAGDVWDHALRVRPDAIDPLLVLHLAALADPGLLQASHGAQLAALEGIRCAVRPSDPLALLSQAALAWAELDAGRPLYVGELAALAGCSSAAIFKSNKARREPPFLLTQAAAKISAAHARAYLATRIRQAPPPACPIEATP